MIIMIKKFRLSIILRKTDHHIQFFFHFFLMYLLPFGFIYFQLVAIANQHNDFMLL